MNYEIVMAPRLPNIVRANTGEDWFKQVKSLQTQCIPNVVANTSMHRTG